MKIKDLPPSTNLGGLKIKTPEGRVGYWKSQWNKGVWLTDKVDDGRVYPVFLQDLKEVMEWEIIEDNKTFL